MNGNDRPVVMVTGGAGYIGSHAVLALADAGWRVVVLDNLVTGFRWAVDPRAAFVEGAIEDMALVGRIIADHGVGAILHFAGSVVVPESVADPLKYYRNNTAATRSLLESAVAGGVRHFIFSSTAATYGIPESIPIREDAPKAPINPYGASKLMTERMLADVAAAHPMNYGALRYFNVAGADPGGRSGQSTTGATHLIKVAAEAVTGQRDHVAVFGTDYATPDGTGVRDYIHVSDLADAHVHALEALIAAPTESFTLNCGYGRGYSVLEVLDAVDRATNRPIERRMLPRRPGDPDALVADNAAILARLPWRPKRDDLDVIVADALRWQRHLADLATA
ncbi:UDP-galactose 4-epimerase [Sphingomonas sp. MM-1]|uniref:UDP-glucose 4-epimerase GalE n=1 Tax=Sphingomonas sp. MM-1 TaxID=745310 RepID=UPI0002C0F03D|nr:MULTISPECIES: UDP-glucose 4-epimerase GalE [unclassified Sphingomonas]AGH48383.1 UDP-galactose 4-epimerase [Sphingomonas sp. MM-1]MDX3883568.1 UDP-glucose 4-epimerase GalE [Sphingomonas sp.]